MYISVPRRPSVYKRKKALKHEYIPDNFNVMEGLPEDEYNDDDFIWHTDNDEDEFFVKAEESLEDDDLIMETLDMDENEQIPIAEESNETFEEINADKIDSDSTSPPKKNIKIEENSPPAPHIKILKSERISKVQNSENNINNKNKLGLKFKPKSTCDPLQKSTQAVNEDFENLEGVNDNILLSFKEEKLKECQQNEFIPLEKENFSMEEEHLDESLSIVKPTSAELFGLSIAKDIEGIPSRIFRKIKLRIMHVINEELLKYEMEKEDAV